MFEYSSDDPHAICYDCAHNLKFCQCEGGPSLSEVHSYKRQIVTLRSKYASAVRTLQDIAPMREYEKGAPALARATLKELGEPVEP